MEVSRILFEAFLLLLYLFAHMVDFLQWRKKFPVYCMRCGLGGINLYGFVALLLSRYKFITFSFSCLQENYPTN